MGPTGVVAPPRKLQFRPMLFDAVTFVLGFLPLRLAAFRCLCALGRAGSAASWLSVASLVFYR